MTHLPSACGCRVDLVAERFEKRPRQVTAEFSLARSNTARSCPIANMHPTESSTIRAHFHPPNSAISVSFNTVAQLRNVTTVDSFASKYALVSLVLAMPPGVSK